MDRQLPIAFAPNRYATKWENTYKTWEWVTQWAQNPRRSPETMAEYHKLSKTQQLKIKDHGGFVAGHLKQGHRTNSTILCRSLITLDIDHPEPGLEEALARTGLETLAYPTHSATPDTPRRRIIIPLTRDVTADEYEPVARKIAQNYGINQIDPVSFKPAQLMFNPSCPSDAPFEAEHYEGDWADPDQVLAGYADWTDHTTWPGPNPGLSLNKTKPVNPGNKKGIIGAYCKTHNITDVLENIIPGVYEPTKHPNRWTYTAGTTTAGMIIYDNNQLCYSNHATDPANTGHTLNAFDLARIHLYGHLDTDPEKKEKASIEAMREHAANDPAVKQTLIQARQQQAAQDFTPAENQTQDWAQKLDLNNRGEIKNTLTNLVAILENDPKLAGIAYNEFAHSYDVTTPPPPWKKLQPGWADSDDAALRTYIEQTYGLYSPAKTTDALKKAAITRSFHPVKQWLQNLPEWDGQPRLNYLLQWTLNADNTVYVQNALRKTLIAAITRIYRPGTKFDYALILVGPQGIGKSTLFAKLGGPWYTDTLTLTDMRDKTGAEKLQGNLIVEMAELAGIRKTENEAVKAFISCQDDKYRPAYARNVESHPRQCVIVGTTNSEDGFLRDPTGNRRFWPVQVQAGAELPPWKLDRAWIDQIWAEALHAVKENELLMLPAEAETQAQVERKRFIEHDPRAGLVQEFLDKPIPENWADYSLPDRRAWYEHGDSEAPGLVYRLEVSNVEIWAECFGQEPERMQQIDAYRIGQILTDLGGWERMEKPKRIRIYGLQRLWKRATDAGG